MLDLTAVISLIIEYKYALLFPIALVEGPIVSVLGGFVASLGYLNVYAVLGVVLLGDLIFDTFYYSLGRFGGTGIIQKYGRYLRITEDQIVKLEVHFQKHAGATLLTGKFAHGLGWAVLFSAGVGRMPYKRFLIYNFLSAVLKSSILVTVGYYYGYAYQRISDYFGYASYIFIGLALVLVIGYYFATRAVKRML